MQTALAKVIVACAVLAGSGAGLAYAQEIPDLVGTWTGETQAVYIGPNPYRLPEKAGPNFGDNFIKFTYVVKEQAGTRFAGETEGTFTETFIGMLKPPDFRSGIFIDLDGQYEFTLRDDKTIDMCYWHQYPATKVVACWTLTKQP